VCATEWRHTQMSDASPCWFASVVRIAFRDPIVVGELRRATLPVRQAHIPLASLSTASGVRCEPASARAVRLSVQIFSFTHTTYSSATKNYFTSLNFSNQSRS
jgi:hypothetical protein